MTYKVLNANFDMKEGHTLMKYTVITGASSGIGYETAKAFGMRNKNLILVARRENNLQELKQEILKNNPDIDIMIKKVDLSKCENAYLLFDELADFQIETWINNAGFGDNHAICDVDLKKIEDMLNVNIQALTILSTLFVKKYQNVPGTQLINLSSTAGYNFVPAVLYCASKYFVSIFTEGLALQLKQAKALLQVKVLAPHATETEFGKVTTDLEKFDYKKYYSKFHTAAEMAGLLLDLYDSNASVGYIDRETLDFQLTGPKLNW